MNKLQYQYAQFILRLFLTAADRTPLIPSHTLEKIVLTPFHICGQFPVNRPINTSRMPVITSSTVERTVAIAWNAPSRTGASREQKPFHTAESTSVISLKLKPSAFSLSTILWQKVLAVSLMVFHVLMMASRNPSLVFHKCRKAATSVPITATTATTGAEMPPIAAPSFPKEASSALHRHFQLFLCGRDRVL